ncbi:hypothetical protein [uncultured Tateyamaria sp.]|uniref:hypothetical protein n=1 Tax=Tateyamaria sp. 1078 TaxID=3417464 RepID=UPI0026310A49|nr:hypothetical protein [uncultured Tateyamaria sp.]
MSELSKRAFELSYNQVRSQKEDLRAIRNQASFAATLTGLVATFFSSIALSANSTVLIDANYLFSFKAEAIVVVLFVTLSIVLSAVVVSGRSEVQFDLNADYILYAQKHRSKEDDLTTIIENELTEVLKCNFSTNEAVIKRNSVYLTLAFFVGLFQIPAWISLIGSA